MLCQSCKKREATVSHVAQINNKTCSYHLCAMCADELFGAFESSFANGVRDGLFDEPPELEEACPFCGLRFSDYQNTGLLGCPSCYDVFHARLSPYITKIHGKTVHIGKEGGENTAEHDERLRLSILQKKMEDALGRGDFDEAGKINVKMNSIKKRDGGEWRW